MPATANLRFLDAPGDVARRMRELDWSASPLGPPEGWPQSLRSVVSLLLHSKFPMFVAWGPQLGFLYNDPYAEILGSKHPAAIGQPFERIWAEIWDDIRGLVERAMAGEASFMEDLPLTMQRKGYKEDTWFTFSYSPVVDERGDVAGMFCTCTETTANVLAERARTKQSQRLRSLFQQAPGLCAVTRGRGHVYEIANPAYLTLVGREGIVGLGVREALPELDQKFIDLLDHVYDSGEPYIGRRIPVELRREDRLEERVVDFVFQPIVDAAGRVDGIFIQGSDITEQVRAEIELRSSELRFQAMTDAMPQMVWAARPDGQVEYFNRQWYAFTGLHDGASHGDTWAEVLHAEDQPEAWRRWRRSVATGEDYEVQYRLRHRSGDYRWVLGRGVAVRGEDGAILRWLGTCTDIHEQQAAQDALRRSEQALRESGRRKDEFLAMLAHELRNPLAPISTASQLLRLDQDPARTRAASEIIARQVRHMTELVDDLLDVSRVTRGLVTLEMEPVDLKEALAGAIEQVRPLIDARGHALRTRMAPMPLWVRGDRTRLVQVFANILNNAAKYTREGGDLEVEMALEDAQAVVRIRDNGQGIESALLPQIFELFTQADRTPDRAQGGLGIGLALVRSLVDLHGGNIAASSAGSGHGAVFTVRLPAIASNAAARAPTADAAAVAGDGAGRLEVVVVDDNVDAAKTLEVLLVALGHEVRVYHRALDALEAIVARPPAIAFLDIGLPDITGHALARRVRERLGERACVLSALSGYGQPQDVAASLASGMDHHLIKPLDYDRLCGVLAEAAARQGA
jgi:PAS domain S-box-containing protein